MRGRRTNLVSGWVNFLIENPRWHNTRQGDMIVKLVTFLDA